MTREHFVFVSADILFLGGIGGCSFMANDEQKPGKTLDAVPNGYKVIEMKTGLPALKKA